MKKMVFVLSAFILAMFCRLEAKAAYDVTAPKLNSVTLDKETVTKPGVLNITLDITEEETGVTRIDVSYSQLSTNRFTTIPIETSNIFTEKYTVSIPISSSFKSGDDYYVAGVRLWDGQGNESYYEVRSEEANKLCLWRINKDGSYSENEFCYVNCKFAIKEEFDVDFQYNIANPNLISKIKNMKNDGVGIVTYDGKNHVANKTIFETIKGTNKTIVFSNDSMQWVFKGNGITGNIKNVDLDVSLSQESGTLYDNTKDVLKINFADNGKLPGKARIRIKSDYMYTLHNFSQPLLLYYINDKDNKLEKINADVNYLLDGTDHWCQFYVEHNSSYIVSAGTAQYVPKSGTVINDTKAKVQYKVIKSGKSGGTVGYKKSTNSGAKTIVIPKTATINGITYKVVSVEANAFKNNKKITKVTLGDNVETVGDKAFYGCKNLTKVTMGKNVKKIKEAAFGGCEKLKTVNMGANVTTIDKQAFYNCSALTQIAIPKKVSKLGKEAFRGCKNLTKVTIGKNVKTIELGTFRGCEKLKTVNMGNNVTSINGKAFYGCKSLTKIIVPEKVAKIDKQAFYNCKKLKTIIIKTSKLTSKKVGDKAFKGTPSTVTIKVPKNKLASYKKILKEKGISSKAVFKKL